VPRHVESSLTGSKNTSRDPLQTACLFHRSSIKITLFNTFGAYILPLIPIYYAAI
jgi:hypothetical protein